LAQLGARLDSELLDEDAPRLPVGLERVRLPTGSVQRDDQLPPQPLAERMLSDEVLELVDELPIAAELEIGVYPLLERGQAQLLETVDLAGQRRLVRQVGERGPSPQRQRLRELLPPLARSERPRLGDEPLEAVEVDRLRRGAEHVPPRLRDER